MPDSVLHTQARKRGHSLCISLGPVRREKLQSSERCKLNIKNLRLSCGVGVTGRGCGKCREPWRSWHSRYKAATNLRGAGDLCPESPLLLRAVSPEAPRPAGSQLRGGWHQGRLPAAGRCWRWRFTHQVKEKPLCHSRRAPRGPQAPCPELPRRAGAPGPCGLQGWAAVTRQPGSHPPCLASSKGDRLVSRLGPGRQTLSSRNVASLSSPDKA